MLYTGQRVQIDVKHVSSSCIISQLEGTKFYQYTAIDEFSWFRYVQAFQEASTYTSTVFLKTSSKHLVSNSYVFKQIMVLNSQNDPLRWKSSEETLLDFLTDGVTYV